MVVSTVLFALCAASLSAASAGASEGPADDPFAQARAALEANRPDEVLLLLDGASGEEAASLLARAASMSLDSNDPVMALHLCQSALRHSEDHPEGLVACARTGLALDQPEDAATYARRLRERHPSEPEGPMLALRAHGVLGDHPEVVEAADAALAMDGISGEQRAEAQRARAQAAEVIRTREAGLRQTAVMERQVEDRYQAGLRRQARAPRKAQVEAPSGHGDGMGESTGRAPGRVTVYYYGRCGRSCIRARTFITRQGVTARPRNFQHNPNAQRELAALLGGPPRGRLYIVVGETVLRGFSEGSVESALRRNGYIN